jgi:type II secretory pathway pseudopilin PulG
LFEVADAMAEDNTGRTADDGSTLVEIVVSIALIGSVVLALLAAVFASVAASSTVYEAAQVETVLLNAADLIERAPQRCEYEAYANGAADAAGWPSVANAITSTVERLVGNSGNESIDWEAQPCGVDVAAFDVQRITITATEPSGRVTRSLTVVKSDVN